MSLPRYGEACIPAGSLLTIGTLRIESPEPTHRDCSGGSQTPGLIGGWTCPCACHTTPENTEERP